MYDKVPNTLLESFLQYAPWEELAIARVVESLTTTTWQKYHQYKLAIGSTTDTLLKKTQFSLALF